MKWDGLAYDTTHRYVAQYGASLFSLIRNPDKVKTILDVGCGTGTLTTQLKLHCPNAKIIAVDNSPDMLRTARAENAMEGIYYDQQDMRTFAAPEPVDLVFSNAALHWMKPAESVVRNLCKSLKPGGQFVAEFGGQHNIEGVRTSVEQALLQMKLADEEELERINPWYFPSLSQYTTLLEQQQHNHQQAFRVDLAMHFSRPTPLEGPVSAAIRSWIESFCTVYLDRVPQKTFSKLQRNWQLQSSSRTTRCLWIIGGCELQPQSFENE